MLRFIDGRPRFVFVEDGARVEGGVHFDMADAEFSHRGEGCTFETVIKEFGLAGDPVLGEIAEIVHDIDLKDGKFNRAEAAGLNLAVRGLASVVADDRKLVRQAAVIFDGLYEYLGRERAEGGDMKVSPKAVERPSAAGSQGVSDAGVYGRHVSFGEALRFWVKLGFISFGGPAGQIAIMHRELVERRRWIGEERFLHALNYCMLLPGPEAQQLAIYIGWLMHRTWGGIVAGAFFVIPSIFVLLSLSYVYAAYGNVPAVAGVLSGFKPVVVAIVVEAVLKIGGRALKRRAHYALAAAAFVAIFFLHVPFPLIVLAAAGVGLAGVRFWPGAFAAPPKTKEADAKTEGKREQSDVLPLVIDDHAPPPPHTLPSRGRALKVLAVGLTLWLVPLIALAAWRGWGSLHAQEYRFFTQAALVTFGGAYAVLAYVTQAAAGPFGWITRAQAVDGLGLAETTPGPLIMVLQFVGFMAGWNNPEGLSRPASAVVGGLVTTYATFLPCFIFIFLGAPYIEVLRGNKNLTGALTGITAAVVGVVLNLALVFGAAVIWPRGLAGGTDFFALVMSAVAFFALYKLKADVLWVILAGGALGLAWTLLGA